MSNKNVLGHSKNSPMSQAVLGWIKKKISHPFSKTQLSGIYSNVHLRQIIKQNVEFSKLTEPLIIAATDYTRGQLKAFCKFGDFDKLISDDQKLAFQDRRLLYWRRLCDSKQIEDALLASASIPVFFPPVHISVSDLENNVEEGWHIDGGVGNNTPTREAAYFLRRMQKLKLAQPGDVYCLKLDSPRIISEEIKEFEFFDVFLRTLEIYHRVHTEPVIQAWSLINRDITKQNTKIDDFIRWLNQQGSIDSDNLSKIEEGLRARLSPTRLNIDLIEIEPSSSLGATLEFEQSQIKKNIERGYLDMLTALKHYEKIDTAEFNSFKNLPLFSTS